ERRHVGPVWHVSSSIRLDPCSKVCWARIKAHHWGGTSMAEETARIRVKLGHIEVEYEGDASFLKKDLLATVTELLELTGAVGAIAEDQPSLKASPDSSGPYHHSTDTIATLIGANKGPDLVLAAVAHLAL